MKILAVSNELAILSGLEESLKTAFPSADVIKETDPLMACKYSFNNEVNYVFASEEMRRMNGSDLLQFIKREHPSVKTYLIFDGEIPSAVTFYDDYDGIVEYPFSSEELSRILTNGEQASKL